MIYVVGSSLIIHAKTIYDYHIQQSMTPSKRSMGRQTDSPPSLKKRKQLSMDDYPNMASFNPPSILFSFERCCVDKIVPDFVLQGKRKK